MKASTSWIVILLLLSGWSTGFTMPDNQNFKGQVEMANFKPDDQDTCVPAWQDYKREFRVRLAAAGLDAAPGKQQTNQLLKCMGIDCIKLYDTFEWEAQVVAVEADDARGIVAVPARPAEDKNDLETVLKKFDAHWGVLRFRSLKRQEFLDTKRGSSQSIMDFIAELKRKAAYCEYGENSDSFICDKIINGVNDEKCSERLLDIPDEELTLSRVVHVCRQCELTKAHLKTISQSDKTDVKQVNTRGRSRGRSVNS